MELGNMTFMRCAPVVSLDEPVCPRRTSRIFSLEQIRFSHANSCTVITAKSFIYVAISEFAYTAANGVSQNRPRIEAETGLYVC
jgi:hypothetical protein